MPKSFFQLSVAEQYEIIRIYGNTAQKNLTLIEKDIWLVWILQQLFQIPEQQQLKIAFKGGTSLSKVFHVVDRFSEDLYITLDYRQFEEIQALKLENQTAPSHLGSGKLRRLNIALKQHVADYAKHIVMPWLKLKLKDIGQGERCDLQLSEDEQALIVNYPSVISNLWGESIQQRIIIEFGGRNVIEPNTIHDVQTEIAQAFSTDFLFPQAQIRVLSAERTFWEKATLIHVECHRGVREHAERLSRHWFDLAILSKHAIGKSAVNNLTLMQDVVALKRIFFNASYAQYDQCLSGNFLLIPGADDQKILQQDYDKMQSAGMLAGHDETFATIMTIIHHLEEEINSLIQSSHITS